METSAIVTIQFFWNDYVVVVVDDVELLFCFKTSRLVGCSLFSSNRYILVYLFLVHLEFEVRQ